MSIKCESVAKHVALCDSCFEQMFTLFKKEIARKAGLTKSKKKARAARLNGSKGGRPRKVKG